MAECIGRSAWEYSINAASSVGPITAGTFIQAYAAFMAEAVSFTCSPAGLYGTAGKAVEIAAAPVFLVAASGSVTGGT